MVQTAIPKGYAVVQLDDGRWYPLRVDRLYDAQYPEGYTMLFLYNDDNDHHLSFLRRYEAAGVCERSAELSEIYEQEHWKHMLMETDVYPERCAYYVDILREITHCRPFIIRYSYGIHVEVLGYTCCCGKHHFPSYEVTEDCIEDALEQVANTVFASYYACQYFIAEHVHPVHSAV